MAEDWARIRHKAPILVRSLAVCRESEAVLGQAANRFWNDFASPMRAQAAHWRGHGPFADDAVWLKLGHIPCASAACTSRSRPWGYEEKMTRNVNFELAGFRAMCKGLGAAVLGLPAVDARPELNEKHCAYLVLMQPLVAGVQSQPPVGTARKAA